MTEQTYNRHLSGIKGGQFAEKHQSEATNVSLAGPPAVSPDFLAWRLEQHGYAQHLSPEHVEDITARLNESLDLSDKNIIKTADEVYSGSAGHSLDDAATASDAVAHLRKEGMSATAASVERVISSKKRLTDADADALVGAMDDLKSLENNGYDHSVANDLEQRLQGLLDRNGIVTAIDELGQVTRVKPAAPDYDVYTVEGTGRKIRVEKFKPLPDGKTAPVPADDPRLHAGEVFDKVMAEGRTFTRSQDGNWPNYPGAIRIQANRPLTDGEAYALSGVVGYANSSAIGGEPLDDPSTGPSRDTPHSFIAHIDTTKGRQGNFEKFEAMIPDIIANGTKPRTGTSTGPIGSQAIPAFKDPGLKVEIYYDDVIEA
ncbi:MAG TPA: hypothetical protein VF885_12540 [Arthrobacter sp.]